MEKGSLRWPFFFDVNNFMQFDFIDPNGNYDLLESYIKKQNLGTIIDIGAWWGPWTLHWQARARRVIIFEPNKHILPKLQYNVKNLQHCTLYPVALGDKKKKISMKTNTHSGTNHIIEQEGDTECCTLDDYNFQDVDVIKIDVEGYEIPVLQGAKNTILRNKPMIQIEANKSGSIYGRTKKDILNYLTGIGMKRLAKKWPDQIWSF